MNRGAAAIEILLCLWVLALLFHLHLKWLENSIGQLEAATPRDLYEGGKRWVRP